MPADFERQIWDRLGDRGVTRAELQASFPKSSAESISVKVYAMRRRGLLQEDTRSGVISRNATEYSAPFVSQAGSDNEPPKRGVEPDPYHAGADHIFDRGQQRGLLPPATECDSPPPDPEPITTSTTQEGEPMSDTKRCPQCKQSKPKTAFRKHKQHCNACLDGGQPPVKPAKAKSKRVKKAAAALGKLDSNGALLIPAGREVRGSVVHGDDGVLFAEITSREAGKEPDQRVTLDRDQVIRIHAWFGRLLAE